MPLILWPCCLVALASRASSRSSCSSLTSIFNYIHVSSHPAAQLLLEQPRQVFFFQEHHHHCNSPYLSSMRSRLSAAVAGVGYELLSKSGVMRPHIYAKANILLYREGIRRRWRRRRYGLTSCKMMWQTLLTTFRSRHSGTGDLLIMGALHHDHAAYFSALHKLHTSTKESRGRP